MPTSNVRFRAGSLREDFIAVLAEYSHTTVREIHEMFAKCIICEHAATIAAVGLDRDSWFGKSKTGKLEFLLFGLCAGCSALPDVKERTGDVIRSMWVC